MREIFNFLNKEEKKILEVLFLLLVVAIFFLLFVALRQRNAYFRSLDLLSSKQRNYQKLNLNKMEREREWLSWKKTRDDIEDLRKNYFYDEDGGINRLRLSLQQIFDKSRITFSQIKYTYTNFEKEKIRKVNISFNLSGSYFSLKRFINFLEELQKFLVIEKIVFLDTPAEGGPLRLKVTLAGYYEA